MDIKKKKSSWRYQDQKSLRVLREEISYNADDDKVKKHSEAAQYNKGFLEI